MGGCAGRDRGQENCSGGTQCIKNLGPQGKSCLGLGTSRGNSIDSGSFIESSHQLSRVMLLMSFSSSLNK